MNYFLTELFLAWRYLRPKRNAVSFITCISVIGVTLGVAVLIVVLAVMTGFTDEMKEKMIDTMGHIQIHDTRQGYISNQKEVVKIVKAAGCQASPIINKHALVQNGEQLIPKMVIGIDPETEMESVDVKNVIVSGKFSLEKGEAIISDSTAHELGIGIGDRIILHSASKITKMVKYEEGKGFKFNEDKAKVFLPDEFKVSAIFSFGKYDFDNSTLFINIEDAAELFELPWDSATSIYVRTKDPFNLNPVLSDLYTKLPDLQLYTWMQMNRQFLGVLVVEKNMMFFLLIFIVLVAAFSIANTLIMVVFQKTREIGLLKALGASPAMILVTFVLQGFMVGIIGTTFGTLLGFAVVHWRGELMRALSFATGMEIFPKQFYYFSELPAHIVSKDVLLICVISILLCTIGALVPAWRAAGLDPSKALRHE